MKYLLVFIFVLSSCESFFYDDYKIIDFKRQKFQNSNKYLKKKSYLVIKGDNLYSISKKFKIPVHDLIKVNNILEPFKIYPNQNIIIPTNQKYRIRKGDTLYSISRRYETNIFELSKLNNISNINNIKVGTELIIPAYKNKKIVINKNQKIKSKSNQNNKVKYNKSNKKLKATFIWPVKGKLISKYGKTKEGFYNDGININSKKGSSVISSEDGKVIYSGNEIPGYGNLILIKHNKNWITAYAHLNDVYIEKGKVVKKGEKIGSVGSSGNVRVPQLHFEIRKGKESVDPLRFL